jgi:hypothetical protein
MPDELLDYLVGADKKRGGHGQAERLRGLDVYGHPEFDR